jgi:hypothetical protein
MLLPKPGDVSYIKLIVAPPLNKEFVIRPGVVVLAYNLSHSGGGDWENPGSNLNQ